MRKQSPTFADKARAFGTIDALLHQLSEGWVYAQRGTPVAWDDNAHGWYRVPAELNGLLALWQLLIDHYRLTLDLDPLRQLSNRLHHGTPITPEQVATCQAIVTQFKTAYRGMDMHVVRSLAKTEQITILLHKAGLSQGGES